MRNTDTLTYTVAGNVRAELGRKRVSQAGASTSLNISQAAFSRRISGAIPFNVEELGKLAKLLGVPVHRFFEGLSQAKTPAA
ncbi:helix-turn-helix domain-containing protein [Hoyosella altamirensis]|uniref:HTH cro/C1-type domain-containing protein n=1 Tax=Hoyosella altamirensis TaxID=616997 RepID=A0A839RUF5_9ACTN|nr:helix-turn-helix domain-containing protein [Hoyosella altamirensis]MBB3039989.1 hypothetical protein [Hoyosella altamirensis]